MTRLFLVGASGRMGQAIRRVVSEMANCEIVGGFDSQAPGESPFPIFTDFSEIALDYDVLIDFSSKELTDQLLAYLAKAAKPAVLATTGLSSEQEERIESLSREMAIFRSANMSVGIYVLSRLAAEANRLLGPGFDCEIVEAHHRGKKDAPSGTAYLLARAVQESSTYERPLVTDRSGRNEARRDGEIGLQALRGGAIAGDHEILFAGNAEVIRLSHHAESREVFAEGALRAANFIQDKPAGLYSMEDMLG